MRLKMMNLTKMARKLYNCAKDIIFAKKESTTNLKSEK
jgi:hypothetical protein